MQYTTYAAKRLPVSLTSCGTAALNAELEFAHAQVIRDLDPRDRKIVNQLRLVALHDYPSLGGAVAVFELTWPGGIPNLHVSAPEVTGDN